jgi:hypothetical protein
MVLCLAAVALLGLVVFGRSARLSGTYTSGNGYLAIEFKSRRALMTMPTGTAEAEYRVERDRVILRHAGGSVILTRNDDGSLDGPMGRMTRRDR